MSLNKRLVVTMVMNLIIPAVQIAGGVVAGSVALISDALHNLSDFTSALIGYFAVRIGERPSNKKLTFGYRRIEVIAAIVNIVLLYASCVYIALEGWARFRDPRPVRGSIVVAVALIGFIANMVSVKILHSEAHSNLNIRSVFLHIMTDAMTSLAVVFIGIVWIFQPWYWLDPVVSWVIVVMILYSGWDILRKAFRMLMNAAPPDLDITEIRETLLDLGMIKDVHHIHLWSISEKEVALAAHIVVPDQMLSDVDRIAEKIREVLFRRFRIGHPILQFETRKYEPAGLLCDRGRNNDGLLNHEHEK